MSQSSVDNEPTRVRCEVGLRGAWRARIDIMYSPPPDEAAEALARDPIDPVEATERFLEDAAADTDEPGKDEIL